MKADTSPDHRHSAQKAYTLIELLAVVFIVSFAAVVFTIVRGKYGQAAAAVATLPAGVVAIFLVCLFYRWAGNQDKKQLARLREHYRTIYRVKELPTGTKNIVKPPGAEIQVGDFGWDARPNRRDGLVHLQGLTVRWQVVWHAGFRPDQIEQVAAKPASQYDYWKPYWAKSTSPPPCPFPVRERNTPTMGRPHHSGHYFQNYPTEYYRSTKDVPPPG